MEYHFDVVLTIYKTSEGYANEEFRVRKYINAFYCVLIYDTYI